jgi:DNA topoisomerase-1
VLGAHPDDGKPVELHAGRYGPYVKHGDVNATLPDRERVNELTLDEALALLAAKAERSGGAGAKPTARRPPARATGARSTAPKPAAPAATAAAPRRAPGAGAGRATKVAARKPGAGAANTPAKPPAGRAAPRTGTRSTKATPRKRGK